MRYNDITSSADLDYLDDAEDTRAPMRNTRPEGDGWGRKRKRPEQTPRYRRPRPDRQPA